MSIALHWLRRDLRLTDNTALAAASRAHELVVPVFVLDPHLLEAEDRGAPRIAFLLDALASLRRDLERSGATLVVRTGSPERELPALARAVGATAVFANRDYSPYARRRDRRVARALRAAGVAWREFKDLLLVEPDECLKDDGSPYTVFTPFARRWRAIAKTAPGGRPRLRPLPPELLARAGSIALPAGPEAFGVELRATIEPAGEAAAKRRLSTFVAQRLPHYRSRRDLPALDGTSHLSPHLKFGTISPRAVFDAASRAIGREVASLDPAKPGRSLTRADAERLGEGGIFLNELCWRDFYQSILFHFPHVLRRPFQRGFERFRWPTRDARLIELWRDGRTGFPIVDAAMRQLAETGWMHNRLRMVVAMFLTKTLLVDYRVGERIFMQRLVDGDVAANNGGWQWSASTGTDAAPYFRIFNPLSQSLKFDPDGEFIRRFVPELRDFRAPLVHEPEREPLRRAAAGYPPPCVDYAAHRARALELLAPVARAAGAKHTRVRV